MLTELQAIAEGSKTTKLQHPWYVPLYSRYLGSVRNEVRKVLELGVGNGESLLMWEEWFPNAEIYGIDNLSEHLTLDGKAVTDVRAEINRRGSPWIHYSNQSKAYIGDQADSEVIAAVCQEADGGPFDLIVDDAGHDPGKQLASLLALFGTVRQGGLYAIEDVQTSYAYGAKKDLFRYLRDVTDGLNRNYQVGGSSSYLPGLAGVHYYPNLVFLLKGSCP